MSELQTNIAFGTFVLDIDEQVLLKGDSRTQLSQKQFELLKLFLNQPKALITKDAIVEAVWDGKAVSDSVITTGVKEVRQLLGDDARNPVYLQTVHRRGYRFLLDVQEVGPLELRENQVPGEKHGFNRRKRTAILIGSAILIVGVIGISLSNVMSSTGSLPNQNNATPAKSLDASIAVLPFEDFSADGDQAWFADGLTEEVLNAFAAMPDLRVASRRASTQFVAQQKDMQGIGQTLGVSYFIEGSVRQAGEQIRITVQLIRADDGFHVWSETYDNQSKVTDILEIQRKVSWEVAKKLGVSLSLQIDTAEVYQISEAGYQRYLAADALLQKRVGGAMIESRQEFENLQSQFPLFAPVYAGLVETRLFSLGFTEENFAECERLIDIALNIDPPSPKVLRAASFLALAQRELPKALDYIDRSLALNPNDPLSYQRRAVVLGNMNQTKASYAALREARLRDPLSPIILANLVFMEIVDGNMGEAQRLAEQNFKWNKDSVLGYASLGKVYYEKGNYAEAYQIWQDASHLVDSHYVSGNTRALLYWRLGLFDKALPLEESPDWYGAATTYLSLGDTAYAIELARKNEQLDTRSNNAFSIYYWARDEQAAFGALNQSLEQRRLLEEDILFPEKTLTDAVQILSILEKRQDPRAKLVRSALEDYFDDFLVEDASTTVQFHQAATWYALNKNYNAALAWLKAGTQKGYILREALLDPLFDPISDSPEYLNFVKALELNALENRQAVLKLSQSVE